MNVFILVYVKLHAVKNILLVLQMLVCLVLFNFLIFEFWFKLWNFDKIQSISRWKVEIVNCFNQIKYLYQPVFSQLLWSFKQIQFI